MIVLGAVRADLHPHDGFGEKITRSLSIGTTIGSGDIVNTNK